MPVPKRYAEDLAMILDKRHQHDADFFATADGRWGKGSPFSTFDGALLLTEIGVKRSDPVMKGIADTLFAAQRDDGRFRPAPKGAIYPCHTANAARALAWLGHARDRRMGVTFEYLLGAIHDDGGWRCATCKLGKSKETDTSNPGVTLAALDAFRSTKHANADDRLDGAVTTLLDHWRVRRPTGPCHFGIGSRFLQVEFPFLRYNLFFWVYVLSHYDAAREDERFLEALELLESKLDDGRVVVENPNRRLAKLELCKKGAPSAAATKRYHEILRNLGRA